MAAEIALQQLKGIRSRVQLEGQSLDEWFQETGMPTLDWTDTEQRLDWPHYSEILDLVAGRRDPQWMTARGAESIDDDEAVLFRSGVLLGFDRCEDALRWMCGPMGPFAAVTPFITNQIDSAAHGGGLLVRSRMTGGLAPSRTHHRFAQGVLQAFPVLLHERPAAVEIQPTPDGADYSIRFARQSPTGWLRRRWRRSHAQPDYLDNVGATYQALIERQISLQEEQERVRELQQRAAASEKLESLGHLTGGVAHDFNNVLTVAKSQLELLAMESDGERRRALQEIMDTCDRGTELARRLLEYVSEARVSPEPLDVQDVLRSVLPMLRNGLGSAGNLLMHLPSRPQTIRVDKGQLENALLNLVVNARDAMRQPGTVTITSETVRVLPDSALAAECEPGDYAKIRVADDASGISPGIASRVFDPYFTTKGDEGTGLGLSMVWGFVKQYGGHAAVSSTVDEGTNVDLWLPLNHGGGQSGAGCAV